MTYKLFNNTALTYCFGGVFVGTIDLAQETPNHTRKIMDDMKMNGGPMVGSMPSEQGQGGYCIEIYVGPDNQVQSVKVESKDDEPMGDDKEFAPGPEGEGMSIKQALQRAMQIYESGGEMVEDGPMPPSPEQEHADLMEGYGKGSYAAQQRGMPMGKVFKGDM